MITIPKIAGRAAFDRRIAEGLFELRLSNFPWGSQPLKVLADLGHDGEHFFVAMRSYESNPRATVTENEGPVHLDSCMEFFFSPCPELRPDYFNMEANPAGAMKFNYGAGRHGRLKTRGFPEVAGMQATRTADYWQLVYQIPFALIRENAPEFTGASGSIIRANMYRCGEQAACTSFVTLFPIDTEKPDYHRPEYFGEMMLA